MSNDKREAEYRQEWIKKHGQADEVVVAEEDKRLVAAIYYYPPEQHVADNKKIWKMIGARMEIERLEEMENEG
jgi:hypothetical protein